MSVFKLKFADARFHCLRVDENSPYIINIGSRDEANVEDREVRVYWEKGNKTDKYPDIAFVAPALIALSDKVRPQIESIVNECGNWLPISGINNYSAFEVTKVVSFIDEAKSDIDYFAPEKPQYIYEFSLRGGVGFEGGIFRAFPSNYQIFVTSHLKDCITEQDISGVYFESPN